MHDVDADTWEKLYNDKCQNKTSNVCYRLAESLSCTQNSTILKIFVNIAIQKDHKWRPWYPIYLAVENNPKGFLTAFDLVVANMRELLLNS